MFSEGMFLFHLLLALLRSLPDTYFLCHVSPNLVPSPPFIKYPLFSPVFPHLMVNYLGAFHHPHVQTLEGRSIHVLSCFWLKPSRGFPLLHVIEALYLAVPLENDPFSPKAPYQLPDVFFVCGGLKV